MVVVHVRAESMEIAAKKSRPAASAEPLGSLNQVVNRRTGRMGPVAFGKP